MVDEVILEKFLDFLRGDAFKKYYYLKNKVSKDSCIKLDFINAFYKAIPTLEALRMDPYFEIVDFDENTISFKFRYGFMDKDVCCVLEWDSAVEIARYTESQFDNTSKITSVGSHIFWKFEDLVALDKAFHTITLSRQEHLAKYGCYPGCHAEDLFFVKNNLGFGSEKQLYLSEYEERHRAYMRAFNQEGTPCFYVGVLYTFLHDHIQSNRVMVKKDFKRNTLMLYGVGFKDANIV